VEKLGEMVGGVITEEVIWDCTTCRACQQACPVYIEHIDKIIDMRRNLTMEKSRFPEAVREALKSLNTRGHPYRGTNATRTTWTEGLQIDTVTDAKEIDILYWVGCSAALDDRNMKVATACPYCLTMLEDGLKAKQVEEKIRAKDPSELLAETLEISKA